MTDKEKELIKEEIERLYKHYLDAQEFDSGYNMALDDILEFIDSIPEEPASEDLEEYYKKEFLPNEWFAKPGQRTMSQFNFFTAKHFAEWQRKKDQETIELAEDHAMLAGMEKMREEMMQNAINGIIDCDDDNEWIEITDKLIVTPSRAGKKVKFIVVKED